MTLEQLRIFVAVAEREHVTQAAQALNLTQSATSAAVSALEARYQTKLFDRVGRRIVLTDAGRIFLSEARAVLARASSAEVVLADLAGLKRGALKLAGSQTVANYWLPQIACRFQASYPGISLGITIGNTETVAAQVHDGSADLGFVEGEIDDAALAVEPVAQDELVLVAAPGHPWTLTPPASPRDLKTARWILREQGSGTRSNFEAVLASLGVEPGSLDVALEMPSNESIRAAAEAGAGVAVMSRLVAIAALRAGTLVAIDFALPKRSFFVLRHKERHATRAAREFLSLVVGGP
ncbi:LysR family transcriptional regulator [Aminobacter sp. AP02]|uniref:LysR family transcriptional regulator n=1 Tax=Aminobacter sp. AP02 TaxID=2135737 RepID=UPI000D6BA522|nr:LysR family transcriptional regulator [Aminobacter sp. AP02]PWK61757.1 DNA-binding transcriptional LysR family regulator [Aminobacter sp. AP02]